MAFKGQAIDMGVSKNRGVSPKMDGENNGKPYFLMDHLGGKTHYFRFNIHMCHVGFGPGIVSTKETILLDLKALLLEAGQHVPW